MTDTTAGEGELAEAVADRDWWNAVGSVVGMRVTGWDRRHHATLADGQKSMQIPDWFAQRILAAQPSAGAQVDFESGYARNAVVNIVERHISGWAGEHADNPYDAAPVIAREIFDALATPAQPDTGDVAALREALNAFISQWNACGPNSGPGRTFKAARDKAVAALTPAREVEMRLETTSENIARDIREGTFPAKSAPQMVPVTDAALSKPNAQGRVG